MDDDWEMPVRRTSVPKSPTTTTPVPGSRPTPPSVGSPQVRSLEASRERARRAEAQHEASQAELERVTSVALSRHQKERRALTTADSDDFDLLPRTSAVQAAALPSRAVTAALLAAAAEDDDLEALPPSSASSAVMVRTSEEAELAAKKLAWQSRTLELDDDDDDPKLMSSKTPTSDAPAEGVAAESSAVDSEEAEARRLVDASRFDDADDDDDDDNDADHGPAVPSPSLSETTPTPLAVILRRGDVRAALERGMKQAVARTEFAAAERLKKSLDAQAARAARLHKTKLQEAMEERHRLEEELATAQGDARTANAALQRAQAAAGTRSADGPVCSPKGAGGGAGGAQTPRSALNSLMDIFSVATPEEQIAAQDATAAASRASSIESARMLRAFEAERELWASERTELEKRVRHAEARAEAADARAESATESLIAVRAEARGLAGNVPAATRGTRGTNRAPAAPAAAAVMTSGGGGGGHVSHRIASFEQSSGEARAAPKSPPGASLLADMEGKHPPVGERVAAQEKKVHEPARTYFEDDDAIDEADGMGDGRFASDALASLLADMEATTRAAGHRARSLAEKVDEDDDVEDGEAC